jgi:hypothetical protein
MSKKSQISRISNYNDSFLSKEGGDNIMAVNKPYGDGARKGAVRDRSQVFNPHTDRFVKRDRDTGQFMDMKSDKKPFKGVSKED